mmetsp:Transcript_57425/g.186544  ORF Transcript_57425/g.186544 Transcript_57425/m.186544 type:complete len:503 (+) Transcript_57425:32-1540(+)
MSLPIAFMHLAGQPAALPSPSRPQHGVGLVSCRSGLLTRCAPLAALSAHAHHWHVVAAASAAACAASGCRWQRSSSQRRSLLARASSADGKRPLPEVLRRVGLQGLLFGAASLGGAQPSHAQGSGSSGASSAAVFDLRGRTACVTGASRGIGKGVAVGLGELGATVFVTGRRKDAIAQTAELVTKAGGRGVPVLCDHSEDAQVQQAFAEIAKETGGKLDILVNNAFQDPALRDKKTDVLLEKGAKFYELPLQVWDDVHRVGLRSHYTASYYAAPLMINSVAPGWRPLLCVTSAPAAVTYYYAAAYGVAKAGSDRLVRDLQVELGPLGIDCVSVWPGVVYTETVQRLYETGDTLRINRVTGGADPEEVCESPLLTGRVIGSLAADPAKRLPPYVSPDGLSGRICVVAEGAEAFGLRDGGAPGTVAGDLWGGDRRPAPSIRSLAYLGPAFIRDKLPENLKWLAARDGPLARRDIKVPFDVMAQDPRTEDPRKQDFVQIASKVNL